MTAGSTGVCVCSVYACAFVSAFVSASDISPHEVLDICSCLYVSLCVCVRVCVCLQGPRGAGAGVELRARAQEGGVEAAAGPPAGQMFVCVCVCVWCASTCVSVACVCVIRTVCPVDCWYPISKKEEWKLLLDHLQVGQMFVCVCVFVCLLVCVCVCVPGSLVQVGEEGLDGGHGDHAVARIL